MSKDTLEENDQWRSIWLESWKIWTQYIELRKLRYNGVTEFRDKLIQGLITENNDVLRNLF